MRKAVIKRCNPLDYAGSEALNMICSNLVFSKKNLRRIVITSCDAGDGKSYLSMHIAQNLAARGKRVALVDADLRRSCIIRQFAVETGGELKGLAHYLAGLAPLDDVLYVTNLPNVCLIPAGRDVKDPIHLLDSPDFQDLLNKLSAAFDLVIIDAPPVGLVIDAAEIAKSCDGAVLVVHYNKTRRRNMAEARNQILKAGCPILGCIINKVSFESISAKKYYNRAYYSHYNNAYCRRTPEDRKRSAGEKK